MRELEAPKANGAAMKNKNGAKTKNGQTLKAKKKSYSELYRQPSSLNKFSKL